MEIAPLAAIFKGTPVAFHETGNAQVQHETALPAGGGVEGGSSLARTSRKTGRSPRGVTASAITGLKRWLQAAGPHFPSCHFKKKAQRLCCVGALAHSPAPTDLLDGGGELQTQLNNLVLGGCEVADSRQRRPARQTKEEGQSMKKKKKTLEMQ